MTRYTYDPYSDVSVCNMLFDIRSRTTLKKSHLIRFAIQIHTFEDISFSFTAMIYYSCIFERMILCHIDIHFGVLGYFSYDFFIFSDVDLCYSIFSSISS